MNNDSDKEGDVRRLVARYRLLNGLINGDELGADSDSGQAAQTGAFSLRSMQVTIGGNISSGDTHAQQVLAHELCHAVQVCQFPAARTLLQALHAVDRWEMLVYLSATSLGKRWSPGEAIFEALEIPAISRQFPRLTSLIRQSVEILIESLNVRPSGLSLYDLIEGSAYAVELVTSRTMGVVPIERPERYTRAWHAYVRCGGRDLQTFAMLVHACLREGAVFGHRDGYYPHPVDMFQYLVAYAPYFETNDLSLVIASNEIDPPPPITAEDSYRVMDHDRVNLAGRSMQRFTGHLDHWNSTACTEDFQRHLGKQNIGVTPHNLWSEAIQDRARRIAKRLFMAYTRGATAFLNERATSDRFIIDQFVALLRQQFGQLDSEAFFWELAGSYPCRVAISNVVREMAPAQVKVRLIDSYPALPLNEYFKLNQRIRDFESVLMLESIDSNFEDDEDPTPWIVACCPECPPNSCNHSRWTQNLEGRPTPIHFYGSCSCESGLPETLRRATGTPFQDLILTTEE